MRRILARSALYLLLACDAPGAEPAPNSFEEQRYGKLMDDIEARIELPAGASSLSHYARYYAIDETGLVTGIFASGYRAAGPDEGCEEILEDMSSRPVPCPDDSNDQLRSGQRRWVGDSDQLPIIMDGGCGVITVVYDPRRSVIESVTCNGVA